MLAKNVSESCCLINKLNNDVSADLISFDDDTLKLFLT